MNIYLENETDTEFQIDSYEDVIRRAVECVAEDKDIPDDADVNVLITDLEGIRQINLQTRDIDSPTDVLSFPYFEFDEPGIFPEMDNNPEEEEVILGDIVLCADKIISQAEEFGHSQERELAFLVVHSMLHLSGYDHMEEKDAALMQSEEKRLMEILGILRDSDGAKVGR